MSIVENFAKVQVLCIGDVMLDRFTDGVIRRISPESPVPVFSAGASKTYPGGAANVARNIAALGGRCTLIGIVGEDDAGRMLGEDLQAGGNIVAILVPSNDRRTTEKTRFVAQGQHVLRVDRETALPLPAAAEQALLAALAQHIGGQQVVVLSDYAKGVLGDDVIRRAIAMARERHVPVIVDPKSHDLTRYKGATVITPNAREIEAATGIAAPDDAGAVAAAEAGLRLTAAEAMLITRAEQGMTLVRRAGGPVHVRSVAREVFDVVGAGDTVSAALALALGAGAELEAAARIANAAAGISVGRRGTSTVSAGELLEELSGAEKNEPGAHLAKLLDWPAAALRVQAWRTAGCRIVFTNGCFDVLHLGHIRLLDFARAQGDKLIIGLNSDASVRRLKGAGRPLNLEADRAEILAALDVVDAVVLFGEDTPQRLIEQIAPDVLVKGGDYAIDQIVGAAFVESRGGKVLRFELVPGKSSTGIIAKLREDGGP
jgi:D-beta-D-heptose 7-phosphate kinase / D-beta-D-heptose 1-phosphate adenosyltransferase